MTDARQIEEMKEERKVLIEYLVMKTKTEDWHGVADAAMDLRELDVKLYVKKIK